jgi:hypothetical protein
MSEEDIVPLSDGKPHPEFTVTAWRASPNLQPDRYEREDIDAFRSGRFWCETGAAHLRSI